MTGTCCERVKFQATSVLVRQKVSMARSSWSKAERSLEMGVGDVGMTWARPERKRRAKVRVKKRAVRRPAGVSWL